MRTTPLPTPLPPIPPAPGPPPAAPPWRRRCRADLVAVLVAAVVALGLAGCGGSPAGESDATPIEPSPTTTTAGAAPAPSAAGLARVARPDGPVDVFAAPGDAEPASTLPATTGHGSPRALLVVGEGDGGWLEVALPTRPNGATGWIRGDTVEVREVDHEIVVDLAARTVTLRTDGEDVLTAPAAVGTAENPTPTGAFYVVDKLSTEGGGAYGPFALGLSGYSDVLTEFAGGDGQVGLHGTDDPASIGEAVSHGCVRVPNDVITRLAEIVPLGTPVTIS